MHEIAKVAIQNGLDCHFIFATDPPAVERFSVLPAAELLAELFGFSDLYLWTGALSKQTGDEFYILIYTLLEIVQSKSTDIIIYHSGEQ